MDNKVPSFEEFNDSNIDGSNHILEMYISERGQVIPETEWKRTPVTMYNSATGLNFGSDKGEQLFKYTNKTGQVGPIANFSVTIPLQLDFVRHAAEHIYRWEHRFDQVDQAEVIADVKTVAPQIVDLILNSNMTPGANIARGTDYKGLIHVYNDQSDLNVIVQAKHRENNTHVIKLAVITVLRVKNMMLSKSAEMPQITITKTGPKITYIPPKSE